MNRLGALVCTLVAVAILVAQGPANAGGTLTIAAVPTSRGTTYTTPVVVAEKGDEVTFYNLEPFPHDVRSVVMGPDDTVWCNPVNPDEPEDPIRNPRQFPLGQCPLLWTPPISMTIGTISTVVYGTENLIPGTTVEFYCTVFPNMRGTLLVPDIP